MEFFFEKIRSFSEKVHLIDIHFTGEKIHDILTERGDNSCCCLNYLEQIEFLIENMNERERLNSQEKAIFFNLSTENDFFFIIRSSYEKIWRRNTLVRKRTISIGHFF